MHKAFQCSEILLRNTMFKKAKYFSNFSQISKLDFWKTWLDCPLFWIDNIFYPIGRFGVKRDPWSIPQWADIIFIRIFVYTCLPGTSGLTPRWKIAIPREISSMSSRDSESAVIGYVFSSSTKNFQENWSCNSWRIHDHRLSSLEDFLWEQGQ